MFGSPFSPSPEEALFVTHGNSSFRLTATRA
jgi:hypothetical protein